MRYSRKSECVVGGAAAGDFVEGKTEPLKDIANDDNKDGGVSS